MGAAVEERRASALDSYLTTVIDNGLGTSTFAARVIISTRATLASAVVGAYGAFTGALHGGAPGLALDMLDDIASSGDIDGWLDRTLAAGGRLMGFGHRVFRVRDPRADMLRAALQRLDPGSQRLAFARDVERRALAALQRRKPGRRLEANIEMDAALLLDAIGLPRDAFTPVFAIARAPAWIAHALEQQRSGRMIRPSSSYVGPSPADWNDPLSPEPSFAGPLGSLKGATPFMPVARPPEDPEMTVSPFDIARVLSEALPHMQRYDEETVVVKYGGHAMGEEEMARSFARDIVLMEQTAINPVVVHGGGPQIGEMLKRLGIKSEFAAGLRITDSATIEIVEMVLAGSINKQIVGFINGAGGKAVGLCGKDGNMVVARKATRSMVDPDSNMEKIIDLGFVGEPEKVDVTVLNQILGRDLIPVLAPLATSSDGVTYNVNADTFAGAIAGALKAKRLLLLTDVPGVLDKSKNLIKQLSIDDARALIADGTISGGMIPKVETCIYALEAGVEGVVILDGKVPHAVLLELLTDHGAGTLMMR